MGLIVCMQTVFPDLSFLHLPTAVDGYFGEEVVIVADNDQCALAVFSLQKVLQEILHLYVQVRVRFIQ